jgi:pimeloyl-ACP methyl ester carboxylesterase
MINYIVTTVFCLWATLLGPSFLHTQGQSGSQPRPNAPESSALRQTIVTTEPIVLETPTGKLFGALELPKSSAPLPVALIIAGSGPTDRNGNSPAIPGANNSLKYLAEGLAGQGIASVRYLISYFKYDPAKEIAKLSIPVLIAQGTTDIQVSAQEAKLLAQAKPSAGILMIEGMNHVLKEVPAEQEKQIKSYTDPSLPVAPKLIEGINGFIKAIKK